MSPTRLGLVILDRDGVINADSDQYIKSPAEWHALPGSLDALADLSRAGAELVVVSNQSGIGRGLFDADALDAIHAKMEREVTAAGGRLMGIYYCPHLPEDGCNCRKPRAGLLERAAADLGRSLVGVPFIGDKLTDVEAARAVGARPMLVRTGFVQHDDSASGDDVEVYADLRAAAAQLLREAEVS